MRFSYLRKGMQTDQIKMGITEITRNGDAIVKLYNKDQNGDRSEILKLISNKTIEVSVKSEEVPQYKVFH